MASYLVAGAISGLGEGIGENVEAEREVKLKDAERAHEMQLENMRQKNAREMQSTRIKADDKREQRRNEFDAISQDVLIGAEETAAGLEREHETDIEGAKIAGRRDVARRRQPSV